MVSEVPVFQEERYKIIEKLSSGGMFSTIYKGKQENDEPVIIKVFNEGTKIEFIEEEINAIHDLQSVFVNKVLDFGQMTIDGQERMVLILEPADNNLNYYASQMSYDQIKAIFRQLVKGLEFIHNHHYVHCDIKGDNILIKNPEDPEPEAFYGDLGMATKSDKYPEEKFQSLIKKDKMHLLFTLTDALLYKITRDSLVKTSLIIEQIREHSTHMSIPEELKDLIFFVYRTIAQTKENPSYEQIEEALTKF